MPAYNDIMNDLKEAMKAQETLKRDTLRLLQSALKNFAIEKKSPVEELPQADIESVIRRLVKQRKDSIEQYRAGNREDLAVNEEAESAILEAYLPAAMPETELDALVTEVLSESGLTMRSQMGQAMGLAMKAVAGRAEGDRVKALVESKLVS